MTDEADALRATMRSVYNACSTGGQQPTHAITGGDVLNQTLGTEDYDPSKMYLVTPDEIKEVE